MLNFVKKSLLLSFVVFSFGCSSTNQTIERKSYNTWEDEVGYSQVVKVNNILYISGITSDESTFENQVDDIYNTITKILGDYNVGTNEIVKEVIFTTDMKKLKSAISTRRAHFNSKKYPASSWVQVERLWSPSLFVEVEIVVVLPQM